LYILIEKKYMEIEYIDRKTTNKFGANALRILDQSNEDVQAFINRPFDLSNFKDQIDEKNTTFSAKQRTLLASSLEKLYSKNNLLDDKRKKRIHSLKDEKTFTVSTGHQLSLFTGPLYFIYKIFHVIKLAESLKKQYPEYNFIPIYWMASEDHDFDEIKTIQLFNQNYSWESNQEGAVGRFKLNEITSFKLSLEERFSNDAEILDLIKNNYNESDHLANATFKFVSQLFDKHDLLVIDADNQALKNSFRSVFEEELVGQFSNKAVEKTNIELENKGFKKQIHSREINLFYINEQNKRSRIIQENGLYQTDEKKFTKEEILLELKNHPERFSPNVVLRPLYQEFILPNLAYVGGAGEISYWLQLKGVFEKANIPYPIIQVRNSIQIIEKSVLKKMEKLGLSTIDIFATTEELKKQYLLKNASEELDFEQLDSLANELASNIENAITKVDGGLKGYAQSEVAKFNKQMNGVKQKLIRQKKKLEEDSMNQIENINERLFPNDTLQERKLNVLQFFVKHGVSKFMEEIYEVINPEENRLIILKE